MTTLLVGLTAVAAACGNPRGPAGPGPTTSGASEDAASFIAKADRELAAGRTLNYKAPRERAARMARFRRAEELLYQACKRGDLPSCWRSFGMPYDGTAPHAYEVAMEVGRRCLAGHDMSCRAMTSPSARKFGLVEFEARAEVTRTCEAGLAAACVAMSSHLFETPTDERQRWLQKACDLGDAMSCSKREIAANLAGEPKQKVEALQARAHDRARAECGQGYAQSCELLFSRYEARDTKRLEETAEEGCRAGLIDDCSILALSKVRPVLRAYGAEVICTTRGGYCDILAGMRSDPSGIRDAYEHGCQLGAINDCKELLKRYQASELPEPVPGRGADLAAFLCQEGYAREVCAAGTK